MGLLFLAFFLLVSISVAATFWAIEAQKKDAVIINLAGRQRMLIQQMTNEALRIEKDGDGEQAHRVALHEAADTFDQTLQAFINGGQAPYLPDRTVAVPTAHSPDILTGLYQVQRTWDTFRRHLDLISTADPASPGFMTALQTLERLSPELVQQADDVVRLYETASSQKIARLRWIQVAFSVSALSLLAVGFLVTLTSVVRPLRALGSITERIGRGDLSTPVSVPAPREIARLAHSFDAMQALLKASQEELIAWTEELEARVDQRTRELAALHEVSREISSHLDIKHVLRSVTDKARELLGGDVGALCLLEEPGQLLTLGALSGPQEALAGTHAPVQCLPVARVLAGGRAVPCGVDDCAGSCGILAVPFRGSHLAAPLRIGNQVIGALCVGSSKAGLFSKEAADLLTKLADSAAIALENARLYEQAERVAMLEERQRIAAEMHDGLAQTLNYLKLKAEQTAKSLEAGHGEEAMGELRYMQSAIAQASQEARWSIANLQEGPQLPQTLQDRLAEAAGEFARNGGPPIDLVIKHQAPLLLPPGETEQVLGVVGEALQNAHRHAEAERITACLEWQDGQVTIAVEDDGQGFDPKALAMNGGGHFGLSIMRARAARIGGRLSIHSVVGQGTRVSLTWPVDDGQRPTNDYAKRAGFVLRPS